MSTVPSGRRSLLGLRNGPPLGIHDREQARDGSRASAIQSAGLELSSGQDPCPGHRGQTPSAPGWEPESEETRGRVGVMAAEKPPGVVQAGREKCRSGWMLERVLISLHQSCPPISNVPFKSSEKRRDGPGI